MKIIHLKTTRRDEFVDITDRVQQLVRDAGLTDGRCIVTVPHTTAGITINEHADPDVVSDILMHLDTAVPWEAGYAHSEGNSAAHIKASLMGSSVTLIIENSKLALGTWQGIFFTEFDGPRTREVWVHLSR